MTLFYLKCFENGSNTCNPQPGCPHEIIAGPVSQVCVMVGDVSC